MLGCVEVPSGDPAAFGGGPASEALPCAGARPGRGTVAVGRAERPALGVGAPGLRAGASPPPPGVLDVPLGHISSSEVGVFAGGGAAEKLGCWRSFITMVPTVLWPFMIILFFQVSFF